jgi:hypothetical protein
MGKSALILVASTFAQFKDDEVATAGSWRNRNARKRPIALQHPFAINTMSGQIGAHMMGLGMVVDRRLPPSSRHHESGVWQGLYRLEVKVVSDSTRCNGKIGRCNGRKTRSCKRDYSDVSSNDS